MQSILDLIIEFDQTLDDAVGLYLDAGAAMHAFAKQLEVTQQTVSEQLDMPVSQLDANTFSYGAGDPNNPHSIHLHSVTQGELRARNLKGGKNHTLLGQRFIVDIYSYWEDGYRSRIADASKMDRKMLKADVFGDIRLLRNSIIHHRGVAKAEVERCIVLTWFKEGDVIAIDQPQFRMIVTEIRKWLEIFGTQKTGRSPQLVGRWGASGHRHIGP